MLYELRIYTMLPGRMDAIRSRFSNHTLGIFARLGMKVTDFWEDAEGKPVLYYVMAFENMDERNRLWETFRNDPEWLKVREASELDGKIVEQVAEIFMTSAPYFKGE